LHGQKYTNAKDYKEAVKKLKESSSTNSGTSNGTNKRVRLIARRNLRLPKVASDKERNLCCFDSSAYYHCTNTLDGMINCIKIDAGLLAADDRPLKGYYKGTVVLRAYDPEGTVTEIDLSDVLYVPNIATNLISKRILR
jgi:hypothetical protein